MNLDPLLGAPFGSTYEVNEDGILYPAERDPIGEWHQAKPTDDHRSNKSINDHKDNSAQGLTQEDIARLKAEGKGGEELVAQLCANSATFSSKTAFAQEKYKKKKMMKHLTRVRARAPTARVICEAYFHKQPAATNYMRYDALGMMLSLGNVGAHAQPLIVETCGGLVVSAAAERQGGHGKICAGHTGKNCNSLDVTRLMNMTDAARESIITAPLTELLRLRGGSGSGGGGGGGVDGGDAKMEDAAAEVVEGAGVQSRPRTDAGAEAAKGEMKAEEKEKNNNEKEGGGGGDSGKPQRERPEGWRSRRIAAATPDDIARLASSRSEGFTSLLLAAPALDPGATLKRLLPLLAPSAPFVAWCYAAQPLAEALEELRSSNIAVNLSLTEPWLRQHQVLPGRTHPTMTTQAGAGGYVLSGNFIPPWARTGKRGGGGGGGGGGAGGDVDEGSGKRARVDG